MWIKKGICNMMKNIKEFVKSFSRQKIVMKIQKDKDEDIVLIFGPELDMARNVCIFQDEIVSNKITDTGPIRDKYKTIIRRLKYNV